ncbi:hypothetical protein RS84_02867 [Microbacterium hydrocarbonoxydans]|uniref:Helix-turn-helix domain-containing protein n=1 Tax=Microbacterium hydrocarbonoxydans TaxID=273678 RepID=A0A0M2HHQ9_9MICO|nr:helix-turn-helix domain-containing protein [Microbacterium hydrocarbonoxydans]KJL46240.1 hypothetical protein RS84_02867 [Microbacterium hydrocarbonoxydans]
MSIGAFRWAKEQEGLRSSEKFVLVMIADHYNDEVHRSWPSIERLADETGLNRTTVMRCIKALETGGFLKVEPWARAYDGGRLNNRYCLPLYDVESKRAKRLPVLSHKYFNNEGKVRFDTWEHTYKHGEEIPAYE